MNLVFGLGRFIIGSKIKKIKLNNHIVSLKNSFRNTNLDHIQIGAISI